MKEFKNLPVESEGLVNYELILTENCNLRCKYCFDDEFSDRTDCSYNPTMPISRIEEILDFIEKTKDKNVSPKINFFGGEPTVNWDFIVEFYNKANARIGNFSSTINTNGVNLNKERIDFLLSTVTAILLIILHQRKKTLRNLLTCNRGIIK